MYCTSNNDRSVSMAVLKMAQCAQVFPNSAKAQLLLANIKKLHLEYLRSDRSESNIRFRQKLEEEITRYLTIVHHKEKFPCALFLEILRQTVETKPDFDAYQVASAFKALESYAFNLIGHPWRKEYHVVRLYCGYFKYHVDRWLINAKYVLAMMGYEQVSDMVMELQEPIDPDHVIITSLNCLIAAVECQIMTQIYEAMKGRVSWQDIAQVRRHHVGDVTKACQLLSTPKHEKSDKHVRSFSEDRSRLADYNWQGRVEKLIDVPSMIHDGHGYSVSVGGQLYTHVNPYNHRLLWESINNPDNFVTAVTNGHDIPDAALVPKSADEHMADSYSLVKEKKKAGKQRDLTRDDSWSYVDRGLEHQGYSRDRSERGDLLRKTPQLLSKQKSAEETLRDMTTRDFVDWAMEPLEPPNTDGNLINFDRSHPWGHAAEALYRHPPVVVYPPAGYTRNAHFPTTEDALARALSTLNMSNVVQGTPTSKIQSSNAVGRNVAVIAAPNPARKDAADAQVIRKSGSSRNSLYDNVPGASSSSSIKAPYNNFSYPVTSTNPATSPAHYAAINPGASNSETVRRRSQQQGNYNTVPVPRHHHHYPKETTSTQVQTDVVEGGLGTGQHRAQSSGSGSNGNARWGHLTTDQARASSEERDRKERNVISTAASVASGRWSCRTCTYSNAADKMICEMCSRSRDAGPEVEPLTSGGLHCEKCTLVNEKGAKECVACSTSLENSPTYV